jgi:cation transport protein ChaC
MWIFGYGSLMWDGWEAKFGCSRKSVATLEGLKRTFAKASIVNWGTKAAPGPTLTLIQAVGSKCQGMAFEFADEREAEINTYLERREGKNFALQSYPARLADGESITARVAIYTGTLIEGKTPDQIADMALLAYGTSGSCATYILGIKGDLDKHGIIDDEVNAICRDLKLKQQTGNG